MDRFEKVIEVVAPVENVFRVLSDYEGYPRWLHNIIGVRRMDGNRTEWHAVAPHEDGKAELSWTAETTVFEPDRRIVWHAVEGDVVADCEVVMQETKSGTTLVRMVRGFEMKNDDRLNADRADLIEYQQLRLEEDLARLKQLVESTSEEHPQSASGDGEQQHAGTPQSEAEKVLRRGVDRLLDEPPSKEWRK